MCISIWKDSIVGQDIYNFNAPKDIHTSVQQNGFTLNNVIVSIFFYSFWYRGSYIYFIEYDQTRNKIIFLYTKLLY